jgi:5-methylthioribose kinase
MFEVTADTVADYLCAAGRVRLDQAVEARELTGGVSNVVILVRLGDHGESFVIKQARGRLRVKEEWLCPLARIWREVEMLQACGKLIQARNAECGARSGGELRGGVPEMLWEDRENYLYAMTAAPLEHRTWKELLFAEPGEVHTQLAAACGHMLAAVHAGSWREKVYADQFDDRTYFELLRVDPYYRQIARVHPDRAEAVARLIDSIAKNRLALVHGDFSPKNLLVWPGQVMLIDYEVGHYGDPAFDLGFFLTHLVLKSMWAGERRANYLDVAAEFWRVYREHLAQVVAPPEVRELERRMLGNLAGCTLARVDGKSPVDYLTAEQQEIVRELGREWLLEPPLDVTTALHWVLSTEY